MGWFALKTVLEKSAAGLIMGHTHIPRVGIVNGFTTYVNNGFDCPACPTSNPAERISTLP